MSLAAFLTATALLIVLFNRIKECITFFLSFWFFFSNFYFISFVTERRDVLQLRSTFSEWYYSESFPRDALFNSVLIQKNLNLAVVRVLFSLHARCKRECLHGAETPTVKQIYSELSPSKSYPGLNGFISAITVALIFALVRPTCFRPLINICLNAISVSLQNSLSRNTEFVSSLFHFF